MESTRNNNSLNAQDLEYIMALRTGDSAGCRKFFYEEIGGILQSIRIELFRGRIDFDELVSELYLYLRGNGWGKLDGFEARNDSRLRTWMIPVAWRFFFAARERLLSRGHLDADADYGLGSSDDEFRIQIAIDVNAVLSRMPNRRYAEIIRLLIIEGYSAQDVASMLGVKVDNVYNLKHRAIVQFMELYGQR